MEEREEIVEVLKETLTDLHPDLDLACTSLADDKILDSFDIITLMSAIKAEFDVAITADLVIPENFNSIDALADLVARLIDGE